MGVRMTSAQIAKYYNVTQRTIYRWEEDGFPVIYLASGQKRYDVEETDEWHRKRAGRRKK